MKKILIKSRKLVVSIVVLAFFMLFSCQKDEIILNNDTLNFSNQLTQQSPFQGVNRMNKSMESFALLLAKTLNNKNVRISLKEEAMKKFDGDFDILYQKFANKQLSEGSFKELLSRNDENSSARGQELLTKIADEIPLLNIAIPINIEKWDTENFRPLVAVRGVDFDDATTKKIRAFDSEGNVHILDATTPPDFPVIVVGLNERLIPIDKFESNKNQKEICPEIREAPYYASNRFDYFLSQDYYAKCGPLPPPNLANPPESPITLNAITTESGIRLTWGMPSSANSANTSGYYVYRQSAAGSFSKISTVNGVYNKAYDDLAIEANASYTYYIKAYYVSESSPASNYVTITAPNYPKPVVSFSAEQNSKTEIELHWSNDPAQFIDKTVLSKHIVGQTSDYTVLKEFNGNDGRYIDNAVTPGKKHKYEIYHVTNTGPSSRKYDFIRVPYRDVSESSPVYIKALKYTNPSLEKWPAGSPEFYIKIMNVDLINKKAITVQDKVIVDFPSGFGTWIKTFPFQGKKVINWSPGFWYDMLSFSVVEYDKSWGKIDIKLGVKYNTKPDAVTEDKFLKLTKGIIDYEYTIQDKGEDCGVAYLTYYEEPNQWIDCPNYGVELLVGEKDWGED